MPRKKSPKAVAAVSVWVGQEIDAALKRLGVELTPEQEAKEARKTAKFIARVKAAGGDLPALDRVMDEIEAKRAKKAAKHAAENEDRRQRLERQATRTANVPRVRAVRPAPALEAPQPPQTTDTAPKKRRRLGSIGYRLPGGGFVDSRLYDDEE